MRSSTSLAAASTWWVSEFLSFGDVAVYGAVLVLLTQKHQTNVAGLVNNTLFQNHADTVPELVVLLEDYQNNIYDLLSPSPRYGQNKTSLMARSDTQGVLHVVGLTVC